MGNRDTSQDGLGNRIESFFLQNFAPVWKFLNKTGWLGGRVNGLIINRAVLRAKPRPHQFSTATDYTSWVSLADRHWSGRHLPPKVQPAGLKDEKATARIFLRPAASKRQHSGKSTLLFASFAQWFTGSFLLTVDADRRQNYSNHQIDLNPLYGLTAEVTDQLRLKSNAQGRRGRLKSEIVDGEELAPRIFMPGTVVKKDEFCRVPLPLNAKFTQASEVFDNIFAFGGDRANTTPVTSAINILFLREHNRLAGLIEKSHPDWEDDRVFETTRNGLIALLIKLVVEEYINHISPYWFKLRADPKVAWRTRWNRPNWIAVEFNLLYRWHGLVPDVFGFDGQDIPVANFILNNSTVFSHGVGKVLDQASRQKAGRLGLFNTAAPLLDIEERSIGQGRRNRLASYNDYREAVGYPRVTDFKQISGDEDVVKGLTAVYDSVDDLEFFVGIFAEDTPARAAVPPMIGRMVALDAFSQALTNPLLSENVFNPETFSDDGWKVIHETSSLAAIVRRNTSTGQSWHISFDQLPRPTLP